MPQARPTVIGAADIRQEPLLHHVSVPGAELAYFEWRPELKGQTPTLLMVHATGFHARVWDPVIARLPGRHVIAMEMRGHGRSVETTHTDGHHAHHLNADHQRTDHPQADPGQASHPGQAIHTRHVNHVNQPGSVGRAAAGTPIHPFSNWEPFGRDVAHFAAALGLQQAVGIGHSMGAHALVQAAAFEPGRFSQLVLIDPVIVSPAAYHLALPAAGAPGAPSTPAALHPAAGRKNHFESAQAMFERFAHRPPYAVFDRQALRAYCDHALLPAPGGVDASAGFVLACAPLTEARIYGTGRSSPGVYASVRALQIPVLIVRARLPDLAILPFDPLGSPTWPGLVHEFHQGREIHLPTATHLLPMEDPALAASIISEALGLG